MKIATFLLATMPCLCAASRAGAVEHDSDSGEKPKASTFTPDVSLDAGWTTRIFHREQASGGVAALRGAIRRGPLAIGGSFDFKVLSFGADRPSIPFMGARATLDAVPFDRLRLGMGAGMEVFWGSYVVPFSTEDRFSFGAAFVGDVHARFDFLRFGRWTTYVRAGLDVVQETGSSMPPGWGPAIALGGAFMP